MATPRPYWTGFLMAVSRNVAKISHGCSLAHKCSNFYIPNCQLWDSGECADQMLHRLEFVVCFLLLFNAVLFLVGFLLTQVRFL